MFGAKTNYKYLGRGCFSEAWQKPNEDRVFLFTAKRERSKALFAMDECPACSIFPKVRKLGETSKGNDVFEMPKYNIYYDYANQKLKAHANERSWQLFEILSSKYCHLHNEAEVDEIIPARFANERQQWHEIVHFMCSQKGVHYCAVDVHSGNVAVNKFGNIIYTDPFVVSGGQE